MRVRKEEYIGRDEFCRKGRVLIVDNDKAVLDEWKYRLERGGYEVFTSESPGTARDLLREQRVHLAIIDLKLVDHNDPMDASGITLAEEIDPIIEKIILTGFPSISTMQMTLGPRLDGKAVAYHYVAKKQPPEVLLRTIERAFSTRIRINFALKITVAEGVFEDLIDGIFVKHKKIVNLIGKEKAAEELSEVFKKIFYSADEIAISPLYSGGYSGTRVVLVKPRRSGYEKGAPIIVKFGGRNEIQIETRNYKNHVAPFLQFRCTTSHETVYTRNLGGLTYSIIGTSLREVHDFREYYKSRDGMSIAKTLEHLFGETCQLWYKNRGNAQDQNLSDLYRTQLGLFPYKKLQKALKEDFPQYEGTSTIRFPTLDRSFINPVIWLKSRKFVFSTHLSCTHGDLNGNNIIVDENGHAWLIDFFRTGYGHILRDFVELEVDIKFNCIETANLTALYEFEKSLVTPRGFDEQCEFKNGNKIAELDKGFVVISSLRQLARAVVEPSNDVRQYYVGLLYHTINMIRYSSLPEQRRRYALLAASLICERLEKWE